MQLIYLFHFSKRSVEIERPDIIFLTSAQYEPKLPIRNMNILRRFLCKNDNFRIKILQIRAKYNTFRWQKNSKKIFLEKSFSLLKMHHLSKQTLLMDLFATKMKCSHSRLNDKLSVDNAVLNHWQVTCDYP